MAQAISSSSKTVPTSAHRASSPDLPCCIGEWQLVDLLAVSRYSSVHAARPKSAPNQPCRYAVKSIRRDIEASETMIALLRREAAVGRKVCHPHLVTVLDAELVEPPYFIVMPRLEGVTLREYLDRNGEVPVTHALWIARQVAEALAALHAGGWLHTDVKPSNIFVSPDGHVTLLDLGFARRLDEIGSAVDRPVAGTFNYIAPELITSAIRADGRSDIYSLGATLYEMLTGRLPFHGDTLAELASQHRQAKPVCIRRLKADLAKPIASLVHRMLAKEPLRRPQSAQEVTRRLVALEIDALSGQLGD